MATALRAIGVRAVEPARLAHFWSSLLGWQIAAGLLGEVTLRPTDETPFELRFVSATDQKSGQNSMHLDLTSRSVQDQRRTVARALELGARHVDVGQTADEPHVVLADPEGNELCVIEPGNGFLRDCGFLGALACDGTQRVGYFWSRVLGWPLVWDQDEATAVRAPVGGPKITWGGEPPADRNGGRDRFFFVLEPADGISVEAETERLVALGASLVAGEPDPARVVLTDPDGHDFCLLRRPPAA